MRDLALAIRQGPRDAVDVESHTADTESRARPEPAHRYLYVLRIVLPVACNQSRHAAEGL